MLPLADDNPTRRFPVLTVALIVLNVVVFLYQSSRPGPADVLVPGGQAAFICEYGVVPDRLVDSDADTADPGALVCQRINATHPRGVGLVTGQFLHAGWLHLLGNILFLWVFGNNVEDRFGRIRFLPFYVLCGIIGALAQTLTDPTSIAPMIGASGAIAGVLGAYLVMFPRARVRTFPLVFIPFPAWVVLGVWFVLQFVYSGGQSQEGQGGVAYWAHVAGFAAGAILTPLFLAGRRPSPPRRPALEMIRE